MTTYTFTTKVFNTDTQKWEAVETISRLSLEDAKFWESQYKAVGCPKYSTSITIE